MTNAMATLRSILEVAYFAANIALLAVAYYGLQQIRLLKLDIRLRTERAAKEKAIEATQSYLNSYATLSGSHLDDFIAKKLSPWQGSIGDFTSASVIKSNFSEMARTRFISATWLPSINMLDSIAAMFVTGVADEETGFLIIGRTFCASVEFNYDVISYGRTHPVNSYFQSTVTLYKTWAPRLTRDEIDEMKRRLEQQSSAIKQPVIPKIGGYDSTGKC